MRSLLLAAVLCSACGSTVQPSAPIRTDYRVLLAGQSNAVLLRDVMPTAANVVQGGTGIEAWAPDQPLGIELVAKAKGCEVFVWWQGEHDAGLADYAARLRAIVAAVRAVQPMPVRIVQIAPSPTLGVIRLMLESVAHDAGNKLINTDDLQTDPDAPAHFVASAYPVVAARIYGSLP